MTEMTAENLHQVANVAGRERELTLIHDVTRILLRDDLGSPADLLDQITNAIQCSWPHPGTIGVRTCLGTLTVATPGVENLTCVYRAEFVVADGRPGVIEVAYAPDRSEAPENPAWRRLLSDLAELIRMAVDRSLRVTALRQSEMSLQEDYQRIRSLAHRLLLAQEVERTQIARELHDDVSQQLAALGIGLSLVEARITGADADGVLDEITRLRHVASGLAEKVRHVSHTLHPGVLQHAGLNAAIASHCETVASQHQFLVRFEARGTFHDVPSDVALCLYRAAQQGLRNVLMHANASRAWVTLVRVANLVELTVADNGRGFDVAAARAHGLGLLSIEERVHVANGTFSVTSRPGGGARLSISVPVGRV